MNQAGQPPRILVLRALGLGDLLTGLPALRALRRHHPGHELVLAAPARLAPAVAATGCADRLLATSAPGREVPRRLDWDAGAPPPVLAVDLHGNGEASRRPLRALRPDRLIGFDPPTADRAGDRTADRTADRAGDAAWRENEHERDRWCRLLRCHGIPADPGDLRMPPPARPSEAPGAVVLHPGADAPSRRWPAARFAAVAHELRRTGRPVVVTAGAGEGGLAHQVAAAAGLPPAAVVGGASDVPFDRLAALVAHAAAVVAGDTGLAHLATALGTPSVTLFGPVSPELWGPPADARHRILWRPDATDGPRPGDAHGASPDPRLLRIGPGDVLSELEALLRPAGSDAHGRTGGSRHAARPGRTAGPDRERPGGDGDPCVPLSR
ncbi:glycosyltransferase family 9 protein [Streptomyces sp. NRRL S-350]|uniref:glycosyltransferase family 9 protein n=1 Tax=Streptomyces sp. NRRL S-350 TaxID=1463902 RepID=UPI0007C54E69|nr:glycosyltransferase family 9 protein [Streptomyces sp. NRRL S-350]